MSTLVAPVWGANRLCALGYLFCQAIKWAMKRNVAPEVGLAQNFTGALRQFYLKTTSTIFWLRHCKYMQHDKAIQATWTIPMGTNLY